ncbi:MAG: hypothetical protein ACYTG7_19495 [Planctomycetota bacterium]|jgi:hypothetical protein
MKRTYFMALIATILSMIVYVGSLDASFVYDDTLYIVNNPQVQDPHDLLLTPFPAYMGEGRGLYRPVTTASLALDYLLFGMEPFGFHLTNILLHGLGTLVFFFVLRQFIQGDAGPFAGALLFGLHPVRSEAVAWAVGRAELLCALGCLLALLLYLKWIQNKRSTLLLVGSLVAFLFAGLSKEIALSFPGIIVAYEILFNRTDSWRARAYRVLPFLLVLVMLMGARHAVLGGVNLKESSQVLSDIAYPERLLLAGSVLSRYLGLFFWPNPLLPHYRPMSFFDPGIVDCLPALLFGIAVIVACFQARRWAFAGALFFVPLLPVLNLVPIGEALAERFLYLPLAGGAMAFGLLIARLAEAKWMRRAALLSMVIMIPLGYMTIVQTEVWTDQNALWRHTVEKDPENPKAHMGLALGLLAKGEILGEEGALAHFNRVTEINPNYRPERVQFNIGRAYEELGRLADAMKHYRLSIEHLPFYGEALAAALELTKNPELDAASRLSPDEQARYLENLVRHAPSKELKAELRRRYGKSER